MEEEIKRRVKREFREAHIDCPNCEHRTDDPDYTCEVCWCIGGDGVLSLHEVVASFEVKMPD